MKQGQINKAWRRRYIVLHKGIFHYYLEKSSEPPYGKHKRGQVCLWNYIATTQIASGRIYLSADPLEVEPNASLRILMLTADSDATSYSNDEWVIGFQVHIAYARQLVMSHRHLLTGKYFASSLDESKASMIKAKQSKDLQMTTSTLREGDEDEDDDI